MEKIVFVDENDNVIGSGTREESWETGAWHRIVRVYLLNSEGNILITKRAVNVRTFSGKWNESSSGHVDKDETYEEAALRELSEEVGITGVPLKEIIKIKNKEKGEKGRKLNRFNMIYTGDYDGEVNLDPEEVSETRWITPIALQNWFKESPDDFTEGFSLGFRELVSRGII